ncbi:hypothetical protein WJX81_004609 [Elliptochloris bilobata]|uniref:Dioxygenase n=1 Tax=Elliptochloris bilobata TaxID=381761 RepID=A0AAW1RUY1_9CHLO
MTSTPAYAPATVPLPQPKGPQLDTDALPDEPLFRPRDWAAAFTSQPQEFDYWMDEVEGAVPEALRGTLFRNGPGNFERGEHAYAHPLDGDGYVTAFSFNADGRVHFRSRFVRTRELAAEQAAGAPLYRATFGTARPGGPLSNALDIRLKNPANTNVLLWGAVPHTRLLALWEAGPPYELDPHTLETKAGGPSSLDGWVRAGKAPSTTGSFVLDRALELGSALTAHPHIDPPAPGRSARLALWKWQSQMTVTGSCMRIDVVEYDEAWKRVGGNAFQMEDSFFNPHDFGMTPNHYVFFQNATSFSMWKYLFGLAGPAQCVELVPNQPMKVHVVPRGRGPAKVYEAENAFLIHHANAFEEGDDTIVWSSGWGPEALKTLASGSGMLGSWKVLMKGDFSGIPFTSFWRHRINRVTGEVRREVLYEGQSMDHPKVNPLFAGRPTRFAYFNGSFHVDKQQLAGPPQVWTRLDAETGEAQLWSPGLRCFTEELMFVPGAGGSETEDDGYLLGMYFDAGLERSCLVVLDAADFSKGPVARLWLKHHVPHGLHGFYSEQYYGPLTQ